jgi:hypothetical protein
LVLLKIENEGNEKEEYMFVKYILLERDDIDYDVLQIFRPRDRLIYLCERDKKA